MTFISYKKFGNREYAYELRSYWDKELKQSRHISKYLGVVIDKDKKIFKKTIKEKLLKEEHILDFGDTYLLQKVIEKEGFRKIIEDTFGEDANMLVNLICYKLCYPAAMRIAETWQNGNAIKHFCKAELKSQRISELMVRIGDEDKYRTFFNKYLSFVNYSSDALLLDITAMPNQIHMPFSQWGYHDEEIDKKVNLMLVVDRESKMPLLFRYIPGSVADVSCLTPTVDEMKKHGVKNTFSIFDAGFYSESNIRALQGPDAKTTKIQFMVRIPSNNLIYKDVVQKSKDIENMKYATVYGERGLFVKKHKIDLYGKTAFAYVVLDPVRKGRELRKFILKRDEEGDIDNEKFIVMKKGIMVLISSLSLPEEEVVPLYYSRQIVELLFRFSKDDLDLLPLRVHKEESMRGYLLLIFISLCVFLLLKKKLGKKKTVEEALLILRNLKAKVFKDEIIIPEITKKQRLLFESCEIIVTKTAGI